ncbi:MAG: hypothetical protein RSB59_05760 [Clostridia bacterium]
MNEKLRDFFKNNIGYFIVGFVVIIYVLTAFITIGKTGKTVSQIIADGAVVFFLGFAINRIFDLQGMMNGDRDERVVNTVRLHGEIVTRVAPYIDKLDEWCDVKNKEALRVQRTKILASEGIKYESYFGQDGVARTYEINKERLKDKFFRKAELRRMRCYYKALKIKLTPLTAGALTSEGGKHQDPYYLGRTKEQYETKTSISGILSKVFTACLFGYYGVELIKDFNYASLIWTALQVGVFLIMGVIKMYQSYIFVTDEYRGRIIKKIDNLQKFENYINALPTEERRKEESKNVEVNCNE